MVDSIRCTCSQCYYSPPTKPPPPQPLCLVPDCPCSQKICLPEPSPIPSSSCKVKPVASQTALSPVPTSNQISISTLMNQCQSLRDLCKSLLDRASSYESRIEANRTNSTCIYTKDEWRYLQCLRKGQHYKIPAKIVARLTFIASEEQKWQAQQLKGIREEQMNLQREYKQMQIKNNLEKMGIERIEDVLYQENSQSLTITFNRH